MAQKETSFHHGMGGRSLTSLQAVGTAEKGPPVSAELATTRTDDR